MEKLKLAAPFDAKAPSNDSPYRFAVLDGLRGVSILLVMLSHAMSRRLNEVSSTGMGILKVFIHGVVGVRVFLVISGFIITHILLAEYRRTGTLSLLEFHKRRLMRLVPALYGFLFLVLAMMRVTNPGEVSATCAVDTFAFAVGLGGNCPWNFGHLWSLTVEMCFYLVWPILILRAKGGSIWKPVFTVAGLANALRLLAYFGKKGVLPGWPSEFRPEALGFLDQMAVGALVGYLYSASPKTLAYLERFPRFLVRAISLLFIYVPMFCTQYGFWSRYFLVIGEMTIAIGIAMLMVSLLQNKQGMMSVIVRSKLFTQLGIISYSLYLWQQVFLAPIHLSRSLIPGLELPIVIKFLLCFPVAALSYSLLEKPSQAFARRRGWIGAAPVAHQEAALKKAS